MQRVLNKLLHELPSWVEQEPRLDSCFGALPNTTVPECGGLGLVSSLEKAEKKKKVPTNIKQAPQ
jgi:hypothetical protein